MKLSHLDNWIVKLAGFLMLMGGLGWIGFAIVYHYVDGLKSWDYVPFTVGGIGSVFGAALLSRKATAGATAIVMPLLDRFRIWKPGTTTTVIPAQPGAVVETKVTELPPPA